MNAIDPSLASDAPPSPARMELLMRELMRGVNAMFLELLGSTVKYGPFKGMVIPTPDEESWTDGNFSTKVLGCYEHELHGALAYAVEREPATVINVGCADGYYAIGLAGSMREARVWAFDISEAAVSTCAEFARRNGVADRMVISQGCERAEQLSVGHGHRLYVMDVEGAERELVDPQKCPELATSDLIIECHDFLDGNISLMLANRLAATHAIEIIDARLPIFARYEFLNKTPGIMQVLAVTEKRPMPSLWLACWAHRKGD